MERIKKGDIVQVISGNEKGARGEVKQRLNGWRVGRGRSGKIRNPDADKLLVEKVNIRKKHQKRTGQTRQAGIIELESPIHISDVMLVCPQCEEATRVGFQIEADKKVRFCKRCGSPIDK